MTTVYLARDPLLHRPVILKVICAAGDQTARLLIEAESRGAAIQRELQQRDRRILQVYEWGVEENCFFVALEYFPGRTLAELLRTEGKLAPHRAARYAAEICNQLRSLHSTPAGRASGQKATIHGDIKPSNVQIGAGDELRLLDFGIAKLIRPGHDLTHHQLGSPGYCSPERLRAAQVDVQADLWALGVTLFEMVAGVPPFQAASTHELERLIAGGQPAPLGLPGNCPPALHRVIEKALAPDVGQRYPSAASFESDLRAFLRGAPASNRAINEASADREAASRPPNAGAPADGARLPRAAAPVLPADPPPPPRHTTRGSVTLALLAGALAGLLLFLPTLAFLRLQAVSHLLNAPKDYSRAPAAELAADWQRFQTVRHAGASWQRLVHAPELTAALRRRLISSAQTLLSRAADGSGEALTAAAWERLRLCLLYALEIDPNDRRAQAELHVADANLRLLSDARVSDNNVTAGHFRRAAALQPDWPLPHLALARLYAYRLHNASAAVSELHKAERLGFTLGPREQREQADVYLFRAESSLNRAGQIPPANHADLQKYLCLARTDLEHARSLYEPLASEPGIHDRLDRIYQDQDQEIKLETASLSPPRPKHRMLLLKIKYGKSSASFAWR